MKVFIDPKLALFLKDLPSGLKVEVNEYIEIFKGSGFALFPPILKKLSGYNLWELRPSNVRLLLGKITGGAVVVVGFYKASRQTPKKYIKLALNRLKLWQKN